VIGHLPSQTPDSLTERPREHLLMCYCDVQQNLNLRKQGPEWELIFYWLSSWIQGGGRARTRDSQLLSGAFEILGFGVLGSLRCWMEREYRFRQLC
jgi:hypothetical protein